MNALLKFENRITAPKSVKVNQAQSGLVAARKKIPRSGRSLKSIRREA